MNFKKLIIAFLLGGIMLPYAQTAHGAMWDLFTKDNLEKLAEEEQEIAAEVMPTMARKMLYMFAVGAAVAVLTKPVEKIAKTVIGWIPVINWLYSDDDDDDEVSKKMRKGQHFERIRPNMGITDLANEEINKDMGEILDEVELGMQPEDPLLLYGPTKTGKSTHAKIFASELEKRLGKKAYIYKSSGADFLSKYVGVTPKLIKETAKAASDEAKKGILRRGFQFFINNTVGLPFGRNISKDRIVVIVIDEIDGLFTGRSGDSDYGFAASEALQFVIDEYINTNDNVFLVATTNYLDRIPGPIKSRFEKVFIGNPNDGQREHLIQHYHNYFFRRGFKRNYEATEEDEAIFNLAARETEGFNIADIRRLCRKIVVEKKKDLRKAEHERRTINTIFEEQVQVRKEQKEMEDEEEKTSYADNRNLQSLLRNHDNGLVSPQKQQLQQKQQERKKRKQTIIDGMLTDELIDIPIPPPLPKEKIVSNFLEKKI